MIIKNIIKWLLLSIIIVFAFGVFNPEDSYAVPCTGKVTYKTYGHFSNSNSGNTTWETHMKYTRYYTGDTFNKNINVPAGDGDVRFFVGNFFPQDNRDTIKWYTACVDPVGSVSVSKIGTPSIDCRFAGEDVTIDIDLGKINTTCKSGETDTITYKGCGLANRSYGFVGINEVCPSNNSNCCVKGGQVWCDCQGGSYCGSGNNRCTRFGAEKCDYTGATGNCNRNVDTNSNACVGQNGCCKVDSDCSGRKVCRSKNNAGFGECVPPPDECQDNSDCANNNVCGADGTANECVLYNTKCENVNGVKKCVKKDNNDPNQIQDSYNHACQPNSCPPIPTGLSAATSCQVKEPAITFSWNRVPFTEYYTLWFKKNTAGNGGWRNVRVEQPNSGDVSKVVIENDFPSVIDFNTRYDWYVVARVNTGEWPDSGTAPRESAHRLTESTPTRATCDPSSDLTVHVYKDLNNDKVQLGSGEIDMENIDVYAQGIDGSERTNTAGNVVFPGIRDNTLTISSVTLPNSSWTFTQHTPPQTVTLPYTGEFNIGIQPPAPVVTLTANPTTVRPSQTSALTAVYTQPSGLTGVPTVTWTADTGASISNTRLNTVTRTATATWTAPTSTGTRNPSVSICFGGLCGSDDTAISVTQVYGISGNVFIDENPENQRKDAGESNYIAASSAINIYQGVTLMRSITTPNGVYSATGLNVGTYRVVYNTVASGYDPSYPTTIPPQFGTVTIGTSCADPDGATHDASCSSGNIINLNFGIKSENTNSWFQTGGSDVWFNNGLTNSVPTTASCSTRGPVVSTNGSQGTPGIVYHGISSLTIPPGTQASSNPYDWRVGGVSQYSEPYAPADSGPLNTSYQKVKDLATTNGTPPVSLTSPTNYCGAGGLGACTLSSTLPSGVYEANGSLTLTTANYTFPAGRDYVILVNGNLRISGKIHTPVTSTVLFSVKGDINVSSNVGNAIETFYPTGVGDADLEGWYSADQSFIVEGNNTCPTPDYRLNVAGGIIVNATLTGGDFVYNQRSLCQNAFCPVFYIQERPDFTLNAPRFLKNAPRVYKEVAP